MYYTADHKLKYFTFKAARYRNVNVQVLRLATVLCKYYAFKEAPNSNCNV